MSQAETKFSDTWKNRIPTKLSFAFGELRFQWLYTGGERYCHPFFDETIQRCKSFSENSVENRQETCAETLKEIAAGMDALYPTAILFHVSRCGSTLISQALGSSPLNISISEVPIFDQLLRLPLKGHAISDSELGAIFKSVVTCYGARKNDKEQRFFIKTDSWHLLFHDKLRAIYPDVPFVIVYREPAAVLESNSRHPGIQSVPGLVEPDLFGFDQRTMESFTLPGSYMAGALEQFYTRIITIAGADDNVLLLNYKQGINSMLEQLVAFTGMKLHPGELAAMEERGKYNAKQASKKFAEQNKGDQIFEKPHLVALYDKIEAIRPGFKQ